MFTLKDIWTVLTYSTGDNIWINIAISAFTLWILFEIAQITGLGQAIVMWCEDIYFKIVKKGIVTYEKRYMDDIEYYVRSVKVKKK